MHWLSCWSLSSIGVLQTEHSLDSDSSTPCKQGFGFEQYECPQFKIRGFTKRSRQMLHSNRFPASAIKFQMYGVENKWMIWLYKLFILLQKRNSRSACVWEIHVLVMYVLILSQKLTQIWSCFQKQPYRGLIWNFCLSFLWNSFLNILQTSKVLREQNYHEIFLCCLIRLAYLQLDLHTKLLVTTDKKLKLTSFNEHI